MIVTPSIEHGQRLIPEHFLLSLDGVPYGAFPMGLQNGYVANFPCVWNCKGVRLLLLSHYCILNFSIMQMEYITASVTFLPSKG